MYASFSEGEYGKNYQQLCPTCGRAIEESRVDTPVFEYHGGRCTDFYSAGTFLLTSQTVAQKIESSFLDLSLAEVEISTKQDGYECERLFEIRAKLSVPLDEPCSDVLVHERCATCDWIAYTVRGVAELETFADVQGELNYRIVFPEKLTGVCVQRSDVEGVHVFRYGRYFLLCDEVFREFCETNSFENIAFLPFGRLV